MKYSVEIVCSKFTVGRLRISWHPTFIEIPANFTTGEGDFISTVVDFAGDTRFNFSIPMLSHTLYKEVEDTWIKTDKGTNGALAFSIVNAVVANTTVGDSTVYVNMYVACGEDMDFQMLRDRANGGAFHRSISTNGLIVGGTFVAQGEVDNDSNILDEIFRKSFPPLVPATGTTLKYVCSGEQITDVLSILHRFQQHSNAIVTGGTPLLIDMGTIGLSDRTWDLWNNYYLYHRGSFNFKFVRRDDTAALEGTLFVELGEISGGTGISPNDYSNLFGRNGTVMEDTHYKPSVEWRQPFYHKLAMVGGADRIAAERDEVGSYLLWAPRGGTSAINGTLFMSVGDDFSFAWAVGTPITQKVIDTSRKIPTGGNQPVKTSGIFFK